MGEVRRETQVHGDSLTIPRLNCRFTRGVLALALIVTIGTEAEAQERSFTVTCRDFKGVSSRHDGETPTSTADGMRHVIWRIEVMDDQSALVETVPVKENSTVSKSLTRGKVINFSTLGDTPLLLSVATAEKTETSVITYYPAFGMAVLTRHSMLSIGKEGLQMSSYQFFGRCTVGR